jgi:hypothetical protein
LTAPNQHSGNFCVRRADCQDDGPIGQHLFAGAHADGIAAQHPAAVGIDVPPSDGGTAAAQGICHANADNVPREIVRRSIGRRQVVEMRHPEA